MLEDRVDWSFIWREQRDVFPIEQNLTRGWELKARDHTQGRGLAAARWAEDGDEFAAFDVEVKILNDRNADELLVHMLQADDGI